MIHQREAATGVRAPVAGRDLTSKTPPESVVRHDDDVHRRVGDGRGVRARRRERTDGRTVGEEDDPPLTHELRAVGAGAAPRLYEHVDREAVRTRLEQVADAREREVFGLE